jgi:hypothetical protein
MMTGPYVGFTGLIGNIWASAIFGVKRNFFKELVLEYNNPSEYESYKSIFMALNVNVFWDKIMPNNVPHADLGAVTMHSTLSRG